MVETGIDDLAGFLQSRKDQGLSIGLFLGHRVGTLYNDTLYEALKSHITTARDLLISFKYDTPIAQITQEMSNWVYHMQMLDKSPLAYKFRNCYIFLEEHLLEYGIHKILSTVLPSTHLREEDKLVARLIKADFFDTILTTNFDPLLEEACALLGMQSQSDYELLICGKDEDEDKMISQSSSGYGQIIKIFGDFDSRNYKTAGNAFSLEANQRLKKFLTSKLSKDIVVLGYDPIWDQPIECAFQQTGGMLWYVNEERPPQGTDLAHILDERYTKYLWKPGWSYHSFLQTLSDLLGKKGNRTIEPRDSSPVVQSHDLLNRTTETRGSSPMVWSHDSLGGKMFISYSHKDAEYLERCQTHLKGLLHTELDIIPDNIWDDTKIPLGADWANEIREAITNAKVAILLVSADFLASDFIREKELPPLLEAAKADKIKILPVLVKPSGFLQTELSHYQAINPDTELMKMEEWEREAVWAKLATEIYRLRQGSNKGNPV